MKKLFNRLFKKKATSHWDGLYNSVQIGEEAPIEQRLDALVEAVRKIVPYKYSTGDVVKYDDYYSDSQITGIVVAKAGIQYEENMTKTYTQFTPKYFVLAKGQEEPVKLSESQLTKQDNE